MKFKIFSFLVVSLFLYNVFSQDYRIVPNPTHSTNIVPYAELRSHYVGALPGYDSPQTAGDSCVEGPGYEHHDGNAHQNGYLFFLDSVRFVIKASPPSYPWQYTNVCVAWTGVGSVTTVNLFIVLYDSTSTGPGNLLYISPMQTATGIPVFPNYKWNSTTVTMPVIAHAGYIGVRWDYTTTGAMYLSQDEVSPLWPGYMATVNNPPTWQAIQQNSNFPNYKCSAIREDGSSPSLPPLCEQFEEGTFPPPGWTVIYSGTNYWLYANVSGFGFGSHSAEYSMSTAPSGTIQTLQTSTFLASDTVINRAVVFDIAYAPFPASPPYALDTLVIMTSTNAGTSFTSLVRLGPNQMETAPPMNGPFTPATSQWQHRNYLLPAGTNVIQFVGESRNGNNLYIDSVCFETNLLGIDDNHTQIHSSYSLQQNYPNPFNPTTDIKFDIPKSGIVKLVVYDILGREVETLLDENKEVGFYTVSFDGTNLASGVYFYRMETSSFVSSKQMILLK